MLQIVGAAVGGALQVALVPGVHFGQQPASPGCYDPNPDLSNASLWGWEVILTCVPCCSFLSLHIPMHACSFALSSWHHSLPTNLFACMLQVHAGVRAVLHGHCHPRPWLPVATRPWLHHLRRRCRRQATV